MTGAGSIESWTEAVLANLRGAAEGPEPLLPAVLGLRQMLIMMDRPGPETIGEADVSAIREALQTAVFRLAAAVPEADADAVAIGCGSATGLAVALALPPERRTEFENFEDTIDRADRVALAADLLDAALRRQRIAARGDAFGRWSVEHGARLDVFLPDSDFLH